MNDERNPCWSCGFNEEDIGCTANPYEPWTVPSTCYLYDQDVVDEMINFYMGENKNEN